MVVASAKPGSFEAGRHKAKFERYKSCRSKNVCILIEMYMFFVSEVIACIQAADNASIGKKRIEVDTGVVSIYGYENDSDNTYQGYNIISTSDPKYIAANESYTKQVLTSDGKVIGFKYKKKI